MMTCGWLAPPFQSCQSVAATAPEDGSTHGMDDQRCHDRNGDIA
jgi:hypothetical protein